MEGCLAGCATAHQRRDGPLRVVSLNMLHGFPVFKHLTLRTDLIAHEIRRLDADAVLLQEVPWTIGTGNVARRLASQLGYNYVYYWADGNKNLILFEQGEAILSRYPLYDARFIELTPRSSFFDRRVALLAVADTPWGRLDLFDTYLASNNLLVAEKQTEALREFVDLNSSGSTIISGDFNLPENSPQISALSAIWIDTYRAAHPKDAGYTCCVDDLQAEVAFPMNERIDYIFLRTMLGEAGWKVISAEHAFYQPYSIQTGWQWVSDHTGLMVLIQP